MLVYHAQVEFEDRHEVDARTGRIERIRDEILKPSSLERFRPAGADREYMKGPDGAFDVPEEIGRVLLGKQGWFAGTPAHVPEPPSPVVPEIVQVVKEPAKPRGRPRGTKNAKASSEGDLPVHTVPSAL